MERQTSRQHRIPATEVATTPWRKHGNVGDIMRANAGCHKRLMCVAWSRACQNQRMVFL